MRRYVPICIIIFALFGCRNNSHGSDFILLTPGPFRAAYLIPDPNKSFTQLELLVQSGEIDNAAPEGLAHYVEHLAWLPQLGVARDTSRHSNAWTTNLATGYFISGPAADVPDNLVRLMSISAPFDLNQRFMEEERDIVMREYDQRVLENPYFELYSDLPAKLYDESAHARSTIGTPDSIQSFDLELASAYHARTHVLSNMILIVTGGITEDAVNDALSALPEGTLTPPQPIPPLPVAPMALHETRSLDGIASDELHYLKLVPIDVSMTDAELSVALGMLEDTLDSALPGGIAGPLRYDAFIAGRFQVDLFRHANTHIELRFSAVPDRDVSLGTLRDAFDAALFASAATGIPKETFDTVKKRQITDIETHDDPAQLSRQTLRSQVINRRAPFGYREVVDAIHATTLDDVNALYRALIADGRTVTSFTTPKDESEK